MTYITQWSDGIKPAGANIATIKAKTDLIPAAPATAAGQPLSHLTAVEGNINVAATGSTVVTITPPAGQTWVVDVVVQYQHVTNGGTQTIHIAKRNAGGYLANQIAQMEISEPTKLFSQHATLEITNTNYLEIKLDSGGYGAGTSGQYSYSGWRIS